MYKQDAHINNPIQHKLPQDARIILTNKESLESELSFRLHCGAVPRSGALALAALLAHQ